MPAGTRIRSNYSYGITSDNPLTVGATSFNSAGLVTLPVVSSAHAVITLDPRRQHGDPETVVVTSHTAFATVATISRGTYGTVARSHPQGTEWVHAPIDQDYIEILLSSSRPSDPYEGQFIFESDTNKLVGYGGTDWAPRDAGGQIGYASVTADQTGITTIVDLTGLSTNVTVGTGRRIKITGFISQFLRTAGTATFTNLYIFEGTTQLALTTLEMSNLYSGGSVIWVGTPSAGTHTYKLRANTDGTVTLSASANQPSCILVEDIGAA